MEAMDDILTRLRQQRFELQRRLEALDIAIGALEAGYDLREMKLPRVMDDWENKTRSEKQ